MTEVRPIRAADAPRLTGFRWAVLASALAMPVGERGEVVEVSDRAEAIGYAVHAAGAGDTVLVADKGREIGQKIGGVVYPFDEREVLFAAVEARA